MGVEDDDGVAGGGLGPGESRPYQAELLRFYVELDVGRKTVFDVEGKRVGYVCDGRHRFDDLM